MLSFPSIEELKHLGPEVHIYKIDISQAFRHLKMDPLAYHLLGLYRDARYVNTSHSGQGTEASCFNTPVMLCILHCEGYAWVNYIDNFIGFGTLDVAKKSLDTLYALQEHLGLAVNEKKLVTPSTSVVCLGVVLDTVKAPLPFLQIKLPASVVLKDSYSPCLANCCMCSSASSQHLHSLAKCWTCCIPIIIVQ